MRTIRLFRLIWSLLFVEIRSGDLIPRFHGVAWIRWDVDRAVTMPLPLNLIVGSLRAAWFWAKSGAWRHWSNDQVQRCPHCGRDANMRLRKGYDRKATGLKG